MNQGSHMYFYTPSQRAKKLLYYPVAIGEFFCNRDYGVERDRYDSILAIYVLEGSITLMQGDGEWTAGEDELLLADCYEPHKYFSGDFAHTLWVHFEGNCVREWFRQIKAQKGQKLKCGRQAADCISNIIRDIRRNRSEYDISRELYTLLCQMGKGADSCREERAPEQIAAAQKWILAHFDREIAVEDMANAASMSVSYFSRIFKESTGFSPYDYLLAIRLDKARELLCQTDKSIQDIACQVGFNSTSNFIYFFKKETGISPLKFRRVKF